MALSVSVNGRDLQTAKSIRVAKQLDRSNGTFNIVYSLDETGTTAIEVNDRIQIKADGTTVLDGFAEKFNMKVSANQRMVTVTGRDKTCDLVDSSIRGQKEWSGPISLQAIAEQIITDLGADIQVVDDSENTPDFLATDLLSANPGETCFAFLNRLGKKRQVTITTNVDGNLQFIGGTPQDTGLTLLRIDGGQANNIKDLMIDIDYTDLFSEYRTLGQQNPLRLDDQIPTSTIVNTSGEAQDADARSTRYLEIKLDEDADGQTAQDSADHQASIRRSNAFKVTAVYAGHTLNGIVPEPGKFVSVIDDKFGLDTRAVVRAFTMVYTEASSETQVVLSRENAYTKRVVPSGSSGRAIEAQEFI